MSQENSDEHTDSDIKKKCAERVEVVLDYNKAHQWNMKYSEKKKKQNYKGGEVHQNYKSCVFQQRKKYKTIFSSLILHQK